MKKTYVVFIMLICCFFFSSCVLFSHELQTQEHESQPFKETANEIVTTRWGINLAPIKEPLPSKQSFDTIVAGMTCDEVFALVGDPQLCYEKKPDGFSTSTSFRPTFIVCIYMISDGDPISIIYNKEGDKLMVIGCQPVIDTEHNTENRN